MRFATLAFPLTEKGGKFLCYSLHSHDWPICVRRPLNSTGFDRIKHHLPRFLHPTLNFFPVPKELLVWKSNLLSSYPLAVSFRLAP